MNAVLKFMLAVIAASAFVTEAQAMRWYSPSTGRWLSRDPIGEMDGPNIYAILQNDPVNKTDFLGLKWVVTRKGNPRTVAYATSTSDTFQDLANLIRFDYSDYDKWLQPADARPEPCKRYSIPNTIFIDSGNQKVMDQVPWSIISIWMSAANQSKIDWENNGYRVVSDVGVTDNDITTHLGDANIYGYMFIGHGGPGAIINTYSHLGEDMSGLGPDRYTPHGIAFLVLKACYSADLVPVPRAKYRYNSWESNVSTKGRFIGYEGSVNTINDVFLWTSAPGKNNYPYSLGNR
ncbi:MAG: RHS repeat-associated core domain-containing protein [Verrucomicrobiota bacterium]